MKKRILLIISLLFALFIAACDKPTVEENAELYFSREELTVDIGATIMLPYYATEGDYVLDWSSDNEAVAIVSSSGLLNALSKGTAIITVEIKAENLKAEINIIVKSDEIEPEIEIYFDKSEIEVIMGEVISPAYFVSEGDFELTWSSDNEAVAIVNNSGVVSGIAPGEANITVEIKSENLSAKIKIIVLEKEEVDLNKVIFYGSSNIKVFLGEDFDYNDYVFAYDPLLEHLVDIDTVESNFNKDKEGNYIITLKATNSLGINSFFTLNIEVVYESQKEVIEEDFRNVKLSSTQYVSGTYNGNNNLVWNFSGSRDDQPDGKVTFGGRASDNSYAKTNLSSGISYFRIELFKAFTSSVPRVVGVYIDDVLFDSFSLDVDEPDEQIFEGFLDVKGNVEFKIAMVNPSGDRAQTTISEITIITNPKSNLSANELNLNKDFEALNIKETFIETGNIQLPKLGEFGSTIVWDYTIALDPNNQLLNFNTKTVSVEELNVRILKLSATLKNGNYTKTKVFNLNIGEGSSSLIHDVYLQELNTKIKISGVVTNIFSIDDQPMFFIQDSTGGILVINDSLVDVNEGDLIEFIALISSSTNYIYLENISKIDVLGNEVVAPIEILTDELENLVGISVYLNGLLKNSYDNFNDFYLVNEHGEFLVNIPQGLEFEEQIKDKLSDKHVATTIEVFGNVYFDSGEYKVIVTDIIDLVASDNLDLEKVKDVLFSQLDFPSNNEVISKDIMLLVNPNQDLFEGLNFVFTSSDENLLSNNGIIYRSSQDENVVLSYQVFLGETLVVSGSIPLIILEKDIFSGYYSSLSDLDGSELFAALSLLITDMKNLSYDDAKSILLISDLAPGKTNQILLIYSQTTVANVWNSSIWNREHVWPQSKLGHASKSDIHNLRPANPSVNSSRGNDKFVEGSGSYKKMPTGWYPGDEDRGDVARIVFYMNVRWGLDINLVGNIEVFKTWHVLDPVDDFEIRRNDILYGYQENRNPFIDYPDLVEMLYGKVLINLGNDHNNIESNFIVIDNLWSRDYVLYNFV